MLHREPEKETERETPSERATYILSGSLWLSLNHKALARLGTSFLRFSTLSWSAVQENFAQVNSHRGAAMGLIQSYTSQYTGPKGLIKKGHIA